jgi:hypothetical protein
MGPAASSAPDRRWWKRFESHLTSGDVARVLYGTIVGLALVLAFENEPHHPSEVAWFILATAITIGLAELLSEAIAAPAHTHEELGPTHVRTLARDSIAVVIGAGFPAVYFLLAAAGVIDDSLAFKLAKWTGLALVCGYAYLEARLAGGTKRRAMRNAVAAGLIGFALVEVKSLLH